MKSQHAPFFSTFARCYAAGLVSRVSRPFGGDTHLASFALLALLLAIGCRA